MSRTSNGFSLVEIMMTLAVTSLVGIGTVYFLTDSIKTTKSLQSLTALYQYRKVMQAHFNSSQAWQNTIKSAANPGLNCLADPDPNTKCVEVSSTPLAVYNIGNKVVVDSTGSLPSEANGGLSPNAINCSTYNEMTPDAQCPYQVEVKYDLKCSRQQEDLRVDGTYACTDPVVVLNVNFKTSLSSKNNINFKRLQLTHVRDYRDTENSLCDITEGRLNPATGVCEKVLNCDVCPFGQFFRGWDENGQCLCTDLTPDCQFSLATSSVNESSNLHDITVTFSKGLESQATIPFTITSSTATVDSDYSFVAPSTASSLIMPAETTSTNLSLNILQDTTYEGDETVVFKLNGGGVCNPVPDQDEHTLTIQDDDSKPTLFISHSNNPLTTPTAQAASDAGASNVNVNTWVHLSSVAASPVTVQVNVGGGASHNMDYLVYYDGVARSSSFALNFAAGEVLKQITVQVRKDNVSEGNEAVTLTLNSPSDNAEIPDLIPSKPRTARVTITDVAPTFRFVQPNTNTSFSSITIKEDDPQVVLGARLSNKSTKNIRLSCSFLDASSSADAPDITFSPSTQYIRFAAGSVTSADTCIYKAKKDNVAENNEVAIFRLSLANNASYPGPATAGTPRDHRAVIQNVSGQLVWRYCRSGDGCPHNSPPFYPGGGADCASTGGVLCKAGPNPNNYMLFWNDNAGAIWGPTISNPNGVSIGNQKLISTCNVLGQKRMCCDVLSLESAYNVHTYMHCDEL